MLKQRWQCALTAAAIVPAIVFGGCSTGGGNPFAKTNDFDRTFIGAAQTWDLDKNGSVSCDEWVQYVTTEFRAADANGDGLLDADEHQKMVKSDRLFEVANIAYYDTNGDGRLSVEEMTGKQNIAFKLLDRNGDCQIDRTETVQVHGVDQVKAKDMAPDTTQKGATSGGGRY